MKPISESLREYTQKRKGFTRIKNQLWPKVLEVSKELIELNDSIGRDDYPQDVSGCHSFTVNEKHVVVSWSESWAYGGHDKGTIIFPIEFLLDHEKLLQYKDDQLNIFYEKEKADRKSAIQDARERLRSLKKKGA
jgi:hypothetical protein